MRRSTVLFTLRLIIAGLLLAASSLLLAQMASADSFSSSFTLGSISVSDSSVPPAFLSGPFNYGFSPVGLDTTVVGQVNITSISVSADAVLNSTNPGFGNASAFNWAVFVGPASFGFTPGQVDGTSVRPDSITSSAPTQFQFAQTGATTTLTGSYDFISDAFQANPAGTTFPPPHATFTSAGDFADGLYVQAFMWTEAGDSLDFSNITVTVDGNVTPAPEPSSLLMLGIGLLGLVGFSLKKPL